MIQTSTAAPVANDQLDLTDPKQARQYVLDFKHHLEKEATYVTTSQNRLIHFKTMSDEDAVWVAGQLKQMVEETHVQK